VVLLGRVKDKKQSKDKKALVPTGKKDKRGGDLGNHEKALRSFGNAFKIDDTVLDGLIGVATRDFGPITRLLPRFGRRIDESKIQKFVSLLENLRTLDSASSTAGADGFHPVLSSKLKDLTSEASVSDGSSDTLVQTAMGSLSYADLFDIFDADKSGQLDFSEFLSLLKFLNLNLPRQRAMQLFNTSAGADGNIDKFEFETCMRVLEELITDQVVTEFGYAIPTMVKKFAGLLLVLALLFVFIFLGINAFAVNSSFQSVVNSSFPVLAAGGVSQGGSSGGNSSDQESSVKQVMAQLNTAQ